MNRSNQTGVFNDDPAVQRRCLAELHARRLANTGARPQWGGAGNVRARAGGVSTQKRTCLTNCSGWNATCSTNLPDDEAASLPERIREAVGIGSAPRVALNGLAA